MFVTVLPWRTVRLLLRLSQPWRAGGAAFLGVRAANRNMTVVDERAKATAEWERIYQLVDMASSNDPIKVLSRDGAPHAVKGGLERRHR
jgi:hypothetical protein